MKTMLSNAVKSGLGAVVLSLSTLGQAALITNGDFNDETVWVTDNFSIAEGKATGPLSNETPGSIRQSVGLLNPADTYLLGFSVRKPAGGTFSVAFGDFLFEDSRDDFAFVENEIDETLSTFSGYFTGFSGGEDLVFTFSSASSGDFFLDDVALICDVELEGGCKTSSVPEPGSLLLVGGALAGLGLVRRRKSA